MWIIVWTYVVAAETRSEFELAHGANGDWARLFASGWGHAGTELFAGEHDGHYLTIDRWESEAAFDAFRRSHSDAYDALDRGLEHLAVSAVMAFAGRMLGPAAFP